MSRLVYVSTSTTLGGAEKLLFNLATHVWPSPLEVAGIVSLKPLGEYAQRLENRGLKVLSLEADSILHPKAFRRLSEFFRQIQPDLVHAIMYQAIQLCRLVKRRRNPNFRLISSPQVHYRTRSMPSLWLDQALKGSDDLAISECDASRRFLHQSLHYDPSKLLTIPNAIEKITPASLEVRTQVRKSLGVGPEHLLIGTAGRLDRQKGHAYLLEAFARLKVLHPVRLVIVGGGPLESELKNLSNSLRIQNSVHFAGQQREMSPWFSAMDIFVLPSLWEGMPNALLEAMASKIPCLATEVDGIPEAIDHDRNGLLCRPADSQALHDAIQRLVVSPDLRQTLSEAGRTKVLEKFDLEHMLHSYSLAYEHVSKGVRA